MASLAVATGQPVASEEKGPFNPEPKTPPEAKSSGTELKGPEGPKKDWKAMPGSRTIFCKVCRYFLLEIDSKEAAIRVICHRCKTENRVALQS